MGALKGECAFCQPRDELGALLVFQSVVEHDGTWAREKEREQRVNTKLVRVSKYRLWA